MLDLGVPLKSGGRTVVLVTSWMFTVESIDDVLGASPTVSLGLLLLALFDAANTLKQLPHGPFLLPCLADLLL